MNKTAIKNFAISARKKLIAMAIDKAGIIGITKESVAEPTSRGGDFAVFPTHFGTETRLDSAQLRQRENLVHQIKGKGYDAVMEEVAYTWFNRLIAVRFMEVNDYLPTRVRVLSSETAGKFEPDLVTQAPNVELGFTPAEVEEIYVLKDDPRKSGELFKKLFIKQCNALGEILSELFEQTADYTELLLDLSWDKEDSVVRELLTIEEADFLEAVEIIGWMYQYYNTEPKQRVFDGLKKNVKITKENIPAATQLFTPDWIVRYMVENSLGRLWVEHLQAEDEIMHPIDSPLHDPSNPNSYLYTDTKIKNLTQSWKYYLDEAEQTEEVDWNLKIMRQAHMEKSPEDIKLIDPCMGSGHILVYAFDVLMQIYVSCGYAERDAASLILEKNLYGLDIDKRAYQLSYFALMIKARGYDRRFFGRSIAPQVYCPTGYPDGEEYGSLLLVDEFEPKPDTQLGQMSLDDLHYAEKLNTWNFRRLSAQKYGVVVTNPPYMGSSGMGSKLADYVKKNYPDSKSDLFAVFMEACGRMTCKCGYTAMITQHAWMFLSSFEKLRAKMLLTDTVNMAHLGARAFEEIAGEVVQTTTWVQRNSNIANYKATYARLVDYNSQQGKEAAFLAHSDLHTAVKENFKKIPGAPIAYWASHAIYCLFDTPSLQASVSFKEGITTGDNNIFLRLWHEIVFSRLIIGDSSKPNSTYWIPCNKGGEYRKWYGNRNYVINWTNNGQELKAFKGSSFRNANFQGLEGGTFSNLTSGSFSTRYTEKGFAFESKGTMYFTDTLYRAIGYMNTNVFNYLLSFVCPTLDYKFGTIQRLPYLQGNDDVEQIVDKNIALSKTDWDSFETSWDFEKHPLVALAHSVSKAHIGDADESWYLKSAFEAWDYNCQLRFDTLKANEEELNRIFIDIYGLQDELTPEVEDKDVTVRRADLPREIRSLISYAVGCMFGRYSPYKNGLIYAGGDMSEHYEQHQNTMGDMGGLTFGELGNYTFEQLEKPYYCLKGQEVAPIKGFKVDADNVLPITDEAYFPDDIVTRFVAFIKTLYGDETLEENLDFIAQALGNNGDSSRQVIRNYFLKDFYKDHCKIYQKRPIYWLFDSGKEDGFKALIYLHRYDPDTVGRVRADYLHKQQGFLENAIQNCDYTLENSENARDKADATKKKGKLVKQLAETRLYDQALSHIALQRIPLDLDDGVKVNYEKFQGIEVKNEGTKAVKIDLLGKI